MAKTKNITPKQVADSEDAVAEAAKEVSETKKMLEEAQAKHEEAVQAHADLTAAPPPIYGKHLVIEGGAQEDMPDEWNGFYMFRLVKGGAIYDHVGETPAVRDPDNPEKMLPGVWVYRKA